MPRRSSPRPLPLLLLLLACLLACGLARTQEEKEKMQKAIRMKTTRQLKEIFEELGIDSSGSKEELQKRAYKEDAIGRWEELHPEKKRKPRPASGGGGAGGGFGGGGAGGFGGKAPEGMDPMEWEKLMAQMRGDFSHEPDPEKRRILSKLKAKGMSFGGGSDMSLEQLQNMEKMLDGIGSGAGPGGGPFGGGGAGGGKPKPSRASTKSSMDDEEIADEDKMEL